MGRSIDESSLRIVYKELAVEWHPDRHQGPGKEEAERRMQEISEAFQTLSNPNRRATYDAELDAAATTAERAAAASRFRAKTWNTAVPDVRARVRNAKREDPGFPRGMVAGALLLVVGNMVLVLNWVGG